MMTDLFLILAVAVGVPLIGAISAVVYGILTERNLQVGFTIKTEKEARKYGYPVGSVLVSKFGNSEIWKEPCTCYMPYCLEHRKNDASNLTYVEEKDEMKPQCLYLDTQRGVWFHPDTKKDKFGGQYGYILDNPLGITVIKDGEA